MSIILVMLCHSNITGQRKRLPDQKKITKLTTVDFEKGKNKYPKSYVKKVKGDSITLYTTLKHDKSTSYELNTLNINDFDYVKITNRKTRLKKSLIWGIGLGTVFYVATQQVAKKQKIDASQGLPRAGSNGVVEGLNAGLAGFGIGIIIYNQILHRKMSIKDQKQKILKELR